MVLPEKLYMYLLFFHFVRFDQPHQGGCIALSGNYAIWTPFLWQPVDAGRFSHAVVELEVVDVFLQEYWVLWWGTAEL